MRRRAGQPRHPLPKRVNIPQRLRHERNGGHAPNTRPWKRAPLYRTAPPNDLHTNLAGSSWHPTGARASGANISFIGKLRNDEKNTFSNLDSKPRAPKAVVEGGTVPSDRALLGMGRILVTHFAAKPEWRVIT